MTPDQPAAPVGSVAQEAARLIEALTDRSGRLSSDAPRHDPAADDTTAEGSETHDTTPHDTTAHDTTAEGSTADDSEPGRRGGAAGACPECGAARGVGRAATCQVCPVCQGLALLRALRPETVDRLADLAASVAESLRAAAQDRRASEHRDGAAPEAEAGGDAGEPRARREARHTQHIPVTDDPDPAQDSESTDEPDDDGARA